MRLVPTAVGHRILVKPLKLAEIDPVVARAKNIGIELMDQSERQRHITIDKGTVLAVGPEAFKAFGDTKWCKAGDLIAYPKNAGKFIYLDGQEQDPYLVINDEDVVTVFREE